MLAKKFRLPIQNWTRGKNKKIAIQKGKFFIVKTATNNLDFSRFGAVISAKINKSAVKRNRLKRIIFNFVRLNKFHLMAGKDVLFILLPAVNNLSAVQIKKELASILRQINQ